MRYRGPRVAPIRRYSDDQPRDDHGRFASGQGDTSSGGEGGADVAAATVAAAKEGGGTLDPTTARRGEGRPGQAHRPAGEGQGAAQGLTPLARARELRAKKDRGQRVIVFDFDETITKAPEYLAHVATALKAAGDKIIVLTGNASPRADLIQRLEGYGFPFDVLLQYQDSQSDGIVRSEYLKQLDAWMGVDNRIDRAPTYTKVCPHLFVVALPPKPAKDDAKGTKHDAKKAVKATRAREVRDASGVPVAALLALHDDAHYRPADTAGECCAECKMNSGGFCWGYGNAPIEGDHVCDSFTPAEGDNTPGG